MQIIKLAIAEDQTILRQGLVKMLREYVEFEIIAVASHGKELLNKIKGKQVDLVLLDEEMPEMDGRQTLTVLNRFYPTVKVILLTIRDSLQNIQRLILSGAKTVVSKSVDVSVLVNAIHDVFETGHFYFGLLTPEFFERALNYPEVKCAVIEGDYLSKREMQIVSLICQGKSNGEMSSELSLSQRTIENHRQRIAKKTGCRTTAELVMYAVRNGIVEL